MNDEDFANSNYPFFLTGACIGYLLFCSLVFTPLDDLVMLWPYFLMVFTEPLHGLSGGDMVSILIGDATGLIAIVAMFGCLGRRRSIRDLNPGLGLLIGLVTWPVPLVLIQVIAWFVAGLLGWPTGI
jgi:hypothetical protein